MSEEPAQSATLFGDIYLEVRVPPEHPLRALRIAADRALTAGSVIGGQGRAPGPGTEATLKAMLLQVVYGTPSDRQFLEQLDFNMLYRWFVGMSLDEPVWPEADYASSRARYIGNGLGRSFFDTVLRQTGIRQNLARDGFPDGAFDDPLALFTEAAGTGASDIGAGDIAPADTSTLPETAKQAMAQYGYGLLDAHFGLGPRPAPPDIDLGGYGYERLYLTFYHDGRTRASQSGAAPEDAPDRVVRDIEIAVDRCINDARFGGPTTADEAPETRLVFNFLRNQIRLPGHGLQALQRHIDLGIHAIRVRRGKKSAFFKDSVATSRNLSHKVLIERLCKKAGLPAEAYLDPRTEIVRYDSDTFRTDRAGKVTDLYRYDEPIAEDGITTPSIAERLELAGRWFLNNVNAETGLGEYEYRPSTDSYSPKSNDVRMLATAWSMAELQNFLGNQAFAGPIKSCADRYLAGKRERDGITYIEAGGKAPIALNAFVILLLLGARRDGDDGPLLAALADALVGQQQDDGAFRTYFFSDRATGVDFYPGEAMLALMLLHARTGEAAYRTAVERAFPYYRAYWRGNRNTAFVPWHSQALRELYRVDKDPDIAGFVFEMNDWLIDTHQVFDSRYPDEIGGFPPGLPRFSTGPYLEGINDAYEIAVETGDEAHAAKYRQSIRKGVRFLFQLQITERNAFYLKNPARAIGGCRKSLVRNEQRNDFTQHAVLALIKAHRNKVFPDA